MNLEALGSPDFPVKFDKETWKTISRLFPKEFGYSLGKETETHEDFAGPWYETHVTRPFQLLERLNRGEIASRSLFHPVAFGPLERTTILYKPFNAVFGGNLRAVVFGDVTFSVFRCLQMMYVEFRGVATGNNFEKARGFGLVLKGSARFCNFEGAKMYGCDFSGADLAGSNFKDAIFVGCNFSGADLREVKRKGVEFVDCDFTDAILESEPLESPTLM